MSTQTTGLNISSTLQVLKSGMDHESAAWKIEYRIIRQNIEPVIYIDGRKFEFAIRNIAAVMSEDGETEISPAGPKLDAFRLLHESAAAMDSETITAAVAHAEGLGVFSLYEDNTVALWIDEVTEPGELYAPFQVGEQVAPGFQRSYLDKNYICLQKHTTQADWTPDLVPALWWKVPESSTPGGLPAWAPWPGSGPTYQIGAQVSHNGQNWESTSANNVWEPGVFGWIGITGIFKASITKPT